MELGICKVSKESNKTSSNLESSNWKYHVRLHFFSLCFKWKSHESKSDLCGKLCCGAPSNCFHHYRRLSSSLTELLPFLGKTSNFSVHFGTFCQVTTERSKYQLCETTTKLWFWPRPGRLPTIARSLWPDLLPIMSRTFFNPLASPLGFHDLLTYKGE